MDASVSFIVAVASYLIGSLPTAYIFLKLKHNLDITKEGSGNVGALNSFEVSKSKLIGISVLFIDILKGLIPILIIKQLYPDNFILTAISLVFILTGHCFSIWIKFKGGRGLATALGGSLLFTPAIPIIWCVSWLLIFLKFKDVHYGNIFGTILTEIIALPLSFILIDYCYPRPTSYLELMVLTFLTLNIILIKHYQPIKDIFVKK